jgi:pimeloyl-ACP methyl ester carboxylesterase
MGRTKRLLKASSIARSIFAEESRNNRIGDQACPIVLLPGFVSSSRVLLPLERKLRRLRRPVIRMHLGYGLGDIRCNALQVHDLLESRYAQGGFHYVDVVAHSMGGLVAVYLLKVLSRNYRIRKVITLGTPHFGTPYAIAGLLLFGVISRSIWQMCPFYPLLRDLQRLNVPEDSQLIAVEAHRDSVVPRGYASVVPDDRQSNTRLEGIGHFALLSSGASLALVSSLLEAA